MRELFARFPEVVMIDATHSTNLSKYNVFSIMAHDAFGKGQFVQHAVIQNERNPTLLTALEQFKRYNPAWSRIKCILIDKDFGEISVLKKNFPDATLLLCQFHVLKYLREQIASKDYGFNAWQKQQLNGLINLLVYAKTERQYLRLREYMRHIIDVGTGRVSVVSAWSGGIELGTSRAGLGIVGDQLGTRQTELGTVGDQLGTRQTELGTVGGARDDCKHPFEAYFVKNWDNCRHMWCAFERQNACTLGNNTNNRLESSWKQPKELVDSFMQVDECIVSIMVYQAQAERKLLDAVYKLSVVHHPKYHHEMNFLSKLVSEHACELVYEQYSFAITTAKYNFHEAAPGVYLIQCNTDDEDSLDEPRSEYSVTKSNWSCSCLFMASRLLPCRHVLFIRKTMDFENIIPTQLLDSRWLLSSLRVESELPQLSDEPFRVPRVLKEANTSWDSNRKFREANFVATSISEHLSGLGMVEYRAAMKALRGVATLFRHGEYSTITEIAGGREHEDGLSGEDMDTTGGVSQQTTDSELVSEATEVVQDIPSRQVDTVIQTVASASSLESTQVCADPPDSGTGDEQLGTGGDEFGSVGNETYTGGDEMEEDPTSIATDAEQASFQSETPHEKYDHGSTLTLANVTDDFQIMSPPKSKGRPKQQPRTVKAKWNQAIAMVQEDLGMHKLQMSLKPNYPSPNP